MEKVIIELENIIADLCFCGIADVGVDIIKKFKYTKKLCHELEMPNGEFLCEKILEYISSNDFSSAAKYLCALSCYTQSLSAALE